MNEAKSNEKRNAMSIQEAPACYIAAYAVTAVQYNSEVIALRVTGCEEPSAGVAGDDQVSGLQGRVCRQARPAAGGQGAQLMCKKCTAPTAHTPAKAPPSSPSKMAS